VSSRKRKPTSRRNEPVARAAAAPPSHRRRLALAASVTVVGVAMVGIHDSDVGSAIVLVGLLALLWAIHTYGRLGPEPAAHIDG
jgi:hypothetical protein